MNKYRNKKTGGFDSKKEQRRYYALLLLQDNGLIQDLKRQVPYELIPSIRDETGKCISRRCVYKADFVYTDCATGKTVVEDVKGYKTEVYKIKKKLMLWVHGINIVEI